MQDSDGAQGQVSPNSAMSISPASSEVGSCLNRAASTSIVASNRESSKNSQSNTSSSKHYKSNKGNKSHHRIRNRDRSDMDLDWRRSTTSGGNTTTATTSGSGGGSSSSHHASKTMSADEDPDWRNHKSVEKNNDACTNTISSNKPSKFKGRRELRTQKLFLLHSTLDLRRLLIYQFTFSIFFSFFFTYNFMKLLLF